MYKCKQGEGVLDVWMEGDTVWGGDTSEKRRKRSNTKHVVKKKIAERGIGGGAVLMRLVGARDDGIELVTELDEGVSQHTRVNAQLLVQILDRQRIGVKVHHPVAKK